MPPKQLPDAVDDEIVGPCLGVHRAGLAERRSHTVDKDDITEITRHTGILLISNNGSCCGGTGRGSSTLHALASRVAVRAAYPISSPTPTCQRPWLLWRP